MTEKREDGEDNKVNHKGMDSCKEVILN